MYYSTDPSIWDKISVEIPKKIKIGNLNSVGFPVANIGCKSCWNGTNVIGKIYRLSDCYLPYLRLNELRLKNSDTGELEDESKTGWDGVHMKKMYISKIQEIQMV
ncbi:hypothetical protein PMAYCL1PPCAC_30355, partial [Pristionchus mayeri]